ncbi:hypothetical protein [Alkaliphilus crotonatoxidans]
MMIPLPLHPFTHYLEEYNPSLAVEALPKEINSKKRLFSKGTLSLYRGPKIQQLSAMAIKGLHLYHYDFGIGYPSAEYCYPLFLYQVIIAPKRVLALVHYPFNRPEYFEKLEGIHQLLEEDQHHSQLLIKAFKPQGFLGDDVYHNQFNGLIRTTDIDKAYEAIAKLLSIWYGGLIKQEKSTDTAEIDQQLQWIKKFSARFYHEDYGYISTKRYMGEPWTKNVFENYLFFL